MKFAFDQKVTARQIEHLRLHRIGFNAHAPKEGQILSIAGERVERYTLHPPNTLLSMGAFSYSNGFVGRLQASRVAIGRYCSIAAGTRTLTTTHPVDWLSSHPFQYSRSRYANAEFFDLPPDYHVTDDFKALPDPVVIGNDVWVGMSATIMGGVTIGNGAIVSANAVVTKDVEPYSIVGGVPAKRIKYRFDAELAARIDKTAWWNYHYRDLVGINFADPLSAVEELERRLPDLSPLTGIEVDVRAVLASAG